jgi:hypothetical protein
MIPIHPSLYTTIQGFYMLASDFVDIQNKLSALGKNIKTGPSYVSLLRKSYNRCYEIPEEHMKILQAHDINTTSKKVLAIAKDNLIKMKTGRADFPKGYIKLLPR